MTLNLNFDGRLAVVSSTADCVEGGAPPPDVPKRAWPIRFLTPWRQAKEPSAGHSFGSLWNRGLGGRRMPERGKPGFATVSTTYIR